MILVIPLGDSANEIIGRISNVGYIAVLASVLIFIEESLERKRKIKNEPRTCDIDIIDFNNSYISKYYLSQKIVVPHLNMHKRNFVLIPLYEINQNWFHPKIKKNIVKLLCSLPDNELRSIKFS